MRRRDPGGSAQASPAPAPGTAGGAALSEAVVAVCAASGGRLGGAAGGGDGGGVCGDGAGWDADARMAVTAVACTGQDEPVLLQALKSTGSEVTV